MRVLKPSMALTAASAAFVAALLATVAPPPSNTATAATPLAVAQGGPVSDVVQFAGGSIRLEYDPRQFTLSREEMRTWVRQSAMATAAYFGRFPVPHARLIIEPVRGDQVVTGRAVGRPEPRIVVAMGRQTRAATLARESLLVHEMTHLAIPDHDMRYLWLHEGIATYVEHVARVQAGQATPAEVWAELVREMPEGLPANAQDGGLDATRSESRRYWGGAIYCLIADVQIRRATANRLGLQDALRALQENGGNLSRMWPLERTLTLADRATGTTVLATLYRQMGNRAHRTDLEQLWRELGVRRERGRIVLDDTAPLAAVRNAITSKPSAPLLLAKPRLVRVVDARSSRQARRTAPTSNR